MDTAAITFIDELITLTENEKFANDNEVKDKVERFAFDIILKCLLGDVNNDIQISFGLILFLFRLVSAIVPHFLQETPFFRNFYLEILVNIPIFSMNPSNLNRIKVQKMIQYSKQ